MRVTYITRGPFGVLGGAASYMVPTYMDKYAEVLVLSPDRPGSKEQIVYRNDEINKINTFAVNKKDLLFNTYSSLAKFKPDIVHIFQSPFCLEYLHSFCHIFSDTKWILDIRTQIITDNKLIRREMLKKFFLAQFFVDHIFCQSKHTLGSSLPIRLKAKTELPIGIDLDNFFDQVRGKRKKPVKFLFVGLLAKEREIDVLLTAFGYFQHKSNITITLDIVGSGTAMEQLQNLVKAKKITDVRFLGAMPQKKVHNLMQSYDIGIAYVPYRRYNWAPSLKSIEYAAAGIPILASDTKGHKDYEKRFGFQFNYFQNSVGSIYNALNKVCSRANFDKEINLNKKMAKRFHWDHLVKVDIMPIYQRLLTA